MFTFHESCDNGEVGQVHAGPHEEDEVLVAGPPVDGDVLLKGLQSRLVPLQLRPDESDGHLAIQPLSPVYYRGVLKCGITQPSPRHFD